MLELLWSAAAIIKAFLKPSVLHIGIVQFILFFNEEITLRAEAHEVYHLGSLQFCWKTHHKDDYDDLRFYAVLTLPTLQNTVHRNHIWYSTLVSEFVPA
jgi:hypothetical protein